MNDKNTKSWLAILRQGWSGMVEPEMESAVGWRVATARPAAKKLLMKYA
ncbi:MAG: hypothetical protein JST37_07535 [Bacteroidetes bacterium]|nr:hypothetical protein [Bacteroidota bacterium]